MGVLVPLDGQVFGRLRVLSRAGSDKHSCALWECRCECGATLTVSSNSLRQGRTTSCGCYRAERANDVNTKHGNASRAGVSYLYRAWQNMKARCYNPKSTHYSYYGQRGIRVCDEWINNFQAFADHMGERPSDKHTLDRVDPDGDYTPDNTRWADKKTQSVNRRNTILVTFNGETKPLVQWCELYGVPLRRARYQLKAGKPLNHIFKKEQVDGRGKRS